MKKKIFKKIIISIVIASMFLNQSFIAFAAPPAKKDEQKIKNKYAGKITSINEEKMIISLAELNKEKIKEYRKIGPAAKKDMKDIYNKDFSLDDLFIFSNEKLTIDISNAKFGKPLDIEITNKEKPAAPKDKNEKPVPPDKKDENKSGPPKDKDGKPIPPDKKNDENKLDKKMPEPPTKDIKKGKYDYTNYKIGDFVEVRLEKNSYKAKDVNAVKIPGIKEIIKRINDSKNEISKKDNELTKPEKPEPPKDKDGKPIPPDNKNDENKLDKKMPEPPKQNDKKEKDKKP